MSNPMTEQVNPSAPLPSHREIDDLYRRAEAVWLKRVVAIGENDRGNGEDGKVAAEVLVLLRRHPTTPPAPAQKPDPAPLRIESALLHFGDNLFARTGRRGTNTIDIVRKTSEGKGEVLAVVDEATLVALVAVARM